MYLSATPAPPGNRVDAAGQGELRLTRLARREFQGGSPYDGDPLLEEYLTDMTALYGVRFDPDRYAAGRRTPFTTMADRLLADLGPLDGPLDLIAIAHAGPDADPRRVTACYLCDVAPGDPLAFAVSDQGLAAPFTALRLLNTYARGYPRCRALLIILEQSTLPYEVVAAPYPVPTRDVGVALLLERGGDEPGSAAVTVRRRGGVTRDRAGAALAAELADLAELAPGGVATVLADPGLGPLPAAGGRVAPAGLGCAAPWWLLADEWAAGSRTAGPVGARVLAAHEPTAGELCLATIGITPTEGGVG